MLWALPAEQYWLRELLFTNELHCGCRWRGFIVLHQGESLAECRVLSWGGSRQFWPHSVDLWQSCSVCPMLLEQKTQVAQYHSICSVDGIFPGGTMSFHQSEEMQKGIIHIWITHMWGDSTAEGFPNPRFIHGSNQCQKCSQGLLKCPIPFISHENPLDISRTRVLSFHSCRNSCENLLHHLRSINKAVWLSPDSFWASKACRAIWLFTDDKPGDLSFYS